MIKLNQDGASGVVISLVLCVLLLLAAIGFGAWAFSSRQDYKGNVDSKIGAAVTVAKQQESSLKDVQFAEAEKNPLKTYNGPEAYGSLVLQYPKTWSGYVNDSGGQNGNGNTPVDGYFDPGVVPSTSDQSSVFALRIQVINSAYSQQLQQLQQLQQSSSSGNGKTPTTVNPYALPKLPKVVGVEVTGGLPNQKVGTMVVLPLRSETLELWTEGNQYLSDFNSKILPNFSFSP